MLVHKFHDRYYHDYVGMMDSAQQKPLLNLLIQKEVGLKSLVMEVNNSL